MSQLMYNDVSLQLIKTNMVERIINLSDDKTEYKWTDFIIDVNCIYNPAATSYSQVGPGPGNLPMVTDASIRSTLMTPRQPLLYQEGGITILEIPVNPAIGGALDCDNGPLPQAINITRIGSSRIFYINYIIKCSIYECPPGGVISPIASARYNRTESIDDDYISTMTVSGITYFRTNILSLLGNNADFYRAYLIPQPLLGYKRTQVLFSLDANGSICRWSTTDVEQKQELGSLATPGTAASIGITKMGLTYHVGALQGGPMGTASYGSMASVNVWAQGMRFVNRYSMMQFIVAVAYDKLQNVAPIGMLASGSITEDVFNNRVDMQLSYLVLDDQDGFPGLFMPIQNVVGNQIALITLPNDTGLNPQPIFSKGTRGTAAYELAVSSFAQACAAYNPTDQTATDIDPQAYTPASQYGVGPQVQGFYDPGVPQPPIPQPSLRAKGKYQQRSLGNNDQSMYNAAPSKSNNVTSQGIIQVPIAANVQSVNNYGGGGGGSPTPTPTPSCVNIQLFQPTTKRIVEWSQERVGAVPEVPNPTVPASYSNNLTLLSNTISTNSIEVVADAFNIVYRCSGVYTYSFLNPLQLTDTIVFDIPPWVAITANAYTEIQSGDYEQGIINNPVI